METLNVYPRGVASSLGRHYYQFYKGREDLFRVVIPFLGVGLKNSEACLWVISEAVGVEEAVRELHRQYDLAPYLEKHQLLILPAERWYLERGRFSEHRVSRKFFRFIEERRRLGFVKYRIVGDAGWIDPHHWPSLRSHEMKIHEWLRTVPVTALCAYPIRRCTLTQTKDVLDHHDGVFLTKL